MSADGEIARGELGLFRPVADFFVVPLKNGTEDAAERLDVESGAARKYPTVKMLKKYINEDWAGHPRVRYLDEEERKEYLLEARDGKLYDSSGKPFDSSKGESIYPDGLGRAIFAMDEDGKIYASNYPLVGKFHHSSFLAGGPVGASGEAEIIAGVPKLITPRSGHYWPGGGKYAKYGARVAAIEGRRVRAKGGLLVEAVAPRCDEVSTGLSPSVQGTVNCALYKVQFEQDLGDENLVEWLARDMIRRPFGDSTPEQEIADLTAALRSGASLTENAIPQPHGEHDVRIFLTRVVDRMSALRD